eukprot:scaffold3185_cov111-Isochrysis_galbana.AAC.4
MEQPPRPEPKYGTTPEARTQIWNDRPPRPEPKYGTTPEARTQIWNDREQWWAGAPAERCREGKRTAARQDASTAASLFRAATAPAVSEPADYSLWPEGGRICFDHRDTGHDALITGTRCFDHRDTMLWSQGHDALVTGTRCFGHRDTML